MNTSIIDKLDFKRIVQSVSGYTKTKEGLFLARQLAPSLDRDWIEGELAACQELITLEDQHKMLPIAQLEPIQPAISRLAIGASLNGEELAQIKKSLAIVAELLAFFDEAEVDQSDFPLLSNQLNQLDPLPDKAKRLRQAISDEGQVYDSASAQLAGIRRGMKLCQDQIRQLLNTYLTSKYKDQLSEQLITRRNDRYVLPVKAEYKHQLKGIIHDESATGQTVYIEPAAVVEKGNHLRQLQADERREIKRILKELSEELAIDHPALRQNSEVLAKLDFYQAKSRWAQAEGMQRPRLATDGIMRLIKARHPLLDRDKAVANTITLGEDYETILITGPNTGGKTVLLKTIGLIQLMGQAGLFIPCEAGSQIRIFDEIFADIGDEQSIEQNLSTFSAHMHNIVGILKAANEKSLILLDEIGSGTDPKEGANLAISILDYIGSLGSCVVASTHYPELKAYGYHRLNTVNASMTFDGETLEPTYQLVIGVPGRSNALEIAKRLGMPSVVIQQAEEGLSGQEQSLDLVVEDLENKRLAAQEDLRLMEENLDKSQLLIEDLTTELKRYNHERERLLKEAREEAEHLIKEKSREADRLLEEIRQWQKDLPDQALKEHQLIEKKTAFNQLTNQMSVKNPVLKKAKKEKLLASQLEVGDEVKVLSLGQAGVLVEKTGKKDWLVAIGSIKMKCAQANLEKIGRSEPEKVPNTHFKSARSAHVPPSLDLRGVRYEEAIVQLKRYIDAALLANYPHVTIIHGMGTGAVREAVHKTLKTIGAVDHYAYSKPNEGGYGATQVYFR